MKLLTYFGVGPTYSFAFFVCLVFRRSLNNVCSCFSQDHTENAMWLGSPYPINTSVLSKKEGDGSQYPELGLGYSKKEWE